MLHAAGNLGHESRPAAVVDGDTFKGCVALGAILHPVLDLVQPGRAGPVARQILPGLYKNHPKRAVGRGEHFLSLAQRRCRRRDALRQARQAKGIVAQPDDFPG